MKRQKMKKDVVGREALADMMERTTLCVSGPEPGIAAHDGDKGFRETVQQHYSVLENNVVERLVRLKTSLREATTYDFWSLLMEGMTSITGAQYGFVTKRILVDDQNSAVEMPSIGEPGSCLLGVAFYYNDGAQLMNLHRDYKYLAYGAPCAQMKHDKVFLIPEGLQDFILNNPNQFPFPTEAYLGVPLFAEGKCFGHFGMMWTLQGVENLRLGWGYVELLLHALEDVILERLLNGQSYAKDVDGNKPGKVIPTEAVTASQSLKPYARSLSHELRTPMQGVVGMLDVMHATVQESLEGQSDASVRKVFKTLRDNIEVVQDSSRRAVEAADNVVHAYDLNMQVPDTPNPPNDDDSTDGTSTVSHSGRTPNINIEGKSIFFRRSKRQRTSDSGNSGPVTKHRHVQSQSSTPRREVSPNTASLRRAVEEGNAIIAAGMEDFTNLTPAFIEPEIALDLSEPEYTVTPSLRHTKIRDLLHMTINDSLRNGGRPESAIAEDIDGGEIIEVKTRSSSGHVRTKIIQWSVDSQVPEVILVDERDLLKLVSSIFMNAVKFTEEGKISLRATLTPKAKFILINVVDTGPGIPQAFQPYLFKAFSREDDSLTRQKEGLGLGLMVAKGLARKIGGDLQCVRTDTDGPQRGSEFELRIPLSYTDADSRVSPPARTPTPARLPGRASTAKSRTTRKSSIDHRRTPHSHHTPTASQTPDPFQFKATSPLGPSSFSRRNSLSQQAQATPSRRPSTKKSPTFDRHLAKKHPLTFLVAEDNRINRKLLVNMLGKLGYTGVHEAYDGADAVRQMSIDRIARGERPIDVVLMDLWMPNIDGYEATRQIFAMEKERERRVRDEFVEDEDEDDDGRIRRKQPRGVTVLAVSADVTDTALEKARDVGMEGFMTKPYKLLDLERLVLEYCSGDR